MHYLLCYRWSFAQDRGSFVIGLRTLSRDSSWAVTIIKRSSKLFGTWPRVEEVLRNLTTGSTRTLLVGGNSHQYPAIICVSQKSCKKHVFLL